MIELGLAAPNRVNKTIMQSHLKDIKTKFPGEIFSELGLNDGEEDDDGAMPLV